MTEFRIDIEDSSGNKQGSGPITSASVWRYTARMDKAGDFEFVMPASDPKAFAVQKKRIARAYALLNGAWTEVGAGIIDRIEKQPQADGLVVLRVSGDDLIRELTYRSVLNLKLYDSGLAVSHSAALTATGAYAPAGWTFTPDSSPPNDSIYGYFNGETVLAAMAKIADKSQNHFYRGTGRTLVFGSSFTASGVRAIQAAGDLVAETCAIVSLSEQIDTYDLITRIYPRGSGNANVQLTLRATNRSAPTGYTLSAANNYIENDSANSTYGRIERQIDFRDIGPVDNTDADVQAASNMLFDAALEYLKRNSTELEQATYTLGIAGCSQLLRPMQSIRVVYRDTDANVDIDANLNILEASWQVDASGVYTTDLVVSNADRWPATDVGTIVDNIAEGHIYQALPQLNANSYVTAYTKNVDENNIAAFRFRFGAEVTQLQQVLFEFQILPFESTVKAVGGATSGSGDIATGGPSDNSTSSGGNNETGSGGATSTGSGGSTATGSGGAAATGSDGPTSTGSGGPTSTGSGGNGDTGAAALVVSGTALTTGTLPSQTTSATTPNIGNASLTMGGATPNIGNTSLIVNATSLATNQVTPAIGSATPTIGSTGLDTNGPSGGDVVSGGRHQHSIGITLGGTVTYPVGFSAAGTAGGLVSSAPGGTFDYPTNQQGDHTHSVDSHTHSIDSHTHTIAAHTHTIAAHAHTIAAHSHTIAAHDHTIATHTHTVTSHDHTIAAHTHTTPAHNHTIAIHTHSIAAHDHTMSSHTHTIAQHTHTIAQHTHSIATHTHTIAQHTHSMAEHTHTLNNHTHDLSESITAIYGIFRETALNTYGLTDLDYRVNGGSWANMEDDATNASDGWYELDITSLVQDSTNFRPNQTNNLLEIRSLTANKTATIDAQLSVRNVIQAIAYVN